MIGILSLLSLIVLTFVQSQQPAYVYRGYTDCTFAMTLVKSAGSPVPIPQSIFTLRGVLRLDLEAGLERRPNAPLAPGFVTGGPAMAYPVVSATGSAFASPVAAGNPPLDFLNNITGLVQPSYVFMDVRDGSSPETAFYRDPDILMFIDRVGIRFNTDNASFPLMHIVLAVPGNTKPYTERLIMQQTGYDRGDFLLGQCTRNTFTVTVPTSSSSSTGGNPGAVGDPSFTGFRGQHYQIHGIADTVYNIISDANIVLNAKFVFLTEGQCPILDGKPFPNCWSHAGSYFGSLGLKTVNGDELVIESGSAKQGFALIKINNQVVSMPSTYVGLPGDNKPVTLTVKSTHQMTLNTGLFEFELENSDMFINIVSARVTDWKLLTSKVKSHGLLGQTWQLRKGVIEGSVDDYGEANNELLGHDFMYNKFQPTAKQS